MIVSLTPFRDELDLLEIRLAELDPVVDLHVVTEARITHAGDRKPLHLQRHWERFEPWHDKLKVVTVEDMPRGVNVSEPEKPMAESESDCWRREKHQREALMRGLPDLAPDDVLLLCDIDEIPHPKVFETCAFHAGRGRVIPSPRLAMHVGAMRWRWRLPIAGIARFFSADTLQAHGSLEAVRFAKALEFPAPPESAGWHLAYLGGVNAVRRKLASNAHHELNHPPFNLPSKIASCIVTGDDLFDRPERKAIASPESEWPPYVVANRERFAHLL